MFLPPVSRPYWWKLAGVQCSILQVALGGILPTQCPGKKCPGAAAQQRLRAHRRARYRLSVSLPPVRGAAGHGIAAVSLSSRGTGACFLGFAGSNRNTCPLHTLRNRTPCRGVHTLCAFSQKAIKPKIPRILRKIQQVPPPPPPALPRDTRQSSPLSNKHWQSS